MSFTKYAATEVIASFSADDEGHLVKTASTSKVSHYADGASVINVQAMLDKHADDYQISKNPKDYLWEAIRANTTDVLNGNFDGFKRAELLSVNLGIGKPVYQTYVGAPHHVEHRADDPTRARGIIVDAHYNDEAAPFENCPGCNGMVREASMRDASGIHCAACGTTVKDEFVEILIGIDTTKDPDFAEGKRNGTLKYGSMGCDCRATSCNVCGHVATTRPEFCTHIRQKGSLWIKKAGSTEWSKVSADTAKREMQSRNRTMSGRGMLRLAAADGTEVRLAGEHCIGVVFKEYSSVDNPADWTAEQSAVFDRAASLKKETEELIAKVSSRTKKAMKYTVVKINKDPNDVYVGETLEEALELAAPEEDAVVEHLEIEAMDPEMAKMEALAMEDEAWESQEDEVEAADVNIFVNDGQEPDIINEDVPAEPVAEPEIDNLDVGDNLPDEAVSPEELGMSPPGAGKFSSLYGDWSLKINSQTRVAQLVDTSDRTIMFATASKEASLEDFAENLLGHLETFGLTRTAMKFSGKVTGKIAQIADGVVTDKADGSVVLPTSVVMDTENDAGVDHTNMPGTLQDDVENDIADPQKIQMPESVAVSPELDHAKTVSQPGSTQEMNDDDQLDALPKAPVDTFSNPEVDYKKAMQRMQKLYAKKLESAKTAAKAEAMDELKAAVKVVAKRYALNRELSPLKEQLGIHLTSNSYEQLPDDVAVHVIEAAYRDGGEQEIDSMLERAAQLVERGMPYLQDELADLKKQAFVVPGITSNRISEEARVAAELRREASKGNMTIASAPSENAPVQGDWRMDLRHALASQRTMALLDNKNR